MDKLKMVQSYIIKGENKTIQQALEEKYKNKEHGWNIEGHKVVFWYSSTATKGNNPLSSLPKYTWIVDGAKITTLGGKSMKLTPELDDDVAEKRSEILKDVDKILNFKNEDD